MEILITTTQLIIVCAIAGAIVLISAILCLLRGIGTFIYILTFPCQCFYGIVQCCIYYTDPTHIDTEKLLQQYERNKPRIPEEGDTKGH